MINLPRIEDHRGNLSFIEHSPTGVCPFEIDSVEWIYDVPAGSSHPLASCRGRQSMIVAMSGSFDVIVDGPQGPQCHTLNRSDRAVAISEADVVELANFSTNSAALIISSKPKI